MNLRLFMLPLACQIFFAHPALAQKFDAEVVNLSTTVTVSKEKLIQSDSVVIQVNTRMGENFTDISIPYSRSEPVTDLSAWLEKPDGTRIRDLKKSEIDDKSAISDASFYQDDFIKSFQLKHNEYPYRVVYTYKKTSRDYIHIAWWNPVFREELPTRSATLHILVPARSLYSIFSDLVQPPVRDSSSTELSLTWRSTYNGDLKKEIYSRPDEGVPYVIVAPKSFVYGIAGDLDSWTSFGNWEYRLMEGLDVLPEAEKGKVNELLTGVTDNKEKVKILYHYLQDHTRYINVSIGIGGLKPYPATYVAQNKYGDCKALANYLKALLKYAGIESFYTLVYASEQPRDLISGYYGSQFNHVIIAVPLAKDTIWLETTQNTFPFGYLGTFTQNRDALLIDKEKSHMVRTPKLSVSEVAVTGTLEFDLKASGLASVNVRRIFRGWEFEAFNQLYSDFNEAAKNQVVRNYMPFDNYEVITWDLVKSHRDSAFIELNARMNLYKVIRPVEQELFFSIYPCRIPAFTSPANRLLPLEIPFPICSIDTLIYHLPDGYELKSATDELHSETKYGNYRLKLLQDRRSVIVIRSFTIYPACLSKPEYPAFFAFIRGVKELDSKKLVLKPIN